VVIRWLVLALVAASIEARAGELALPTDVELRQRTSEDSNVVLELPAGETVDVIAQRGRWFKVRARGRTGWISDQHLIELDEPVEAELEAEAEPEPEVVTMRTAIAAGAGLAVLTQGLRTAGSTATADNYNIGVTAATLVVSGRHALRDAIAVEAAYAYSASLPGIRQIDPQGGLATVAAFSIHAASARLVAGTERGAIAVAARAGLRIQRFRIEANPAMLPSELQLAPTLGGELELGRRAKLGLHLALDAYAVGAVVRQTPGQRDGLAARIAGATLHGAVAYRWRPSLALRVAHEAAVTRFDFGAPDPTSARAHGGTSVKRYDVAHTLTVGVVKGF
jgi:hypothetical protein